MFKPLEIGNLIAKIPIIQGGMGVGVSLSNLASAVTIQGGIGILSAAQIGYTEKDFNKNPLKSNLEAITKHIAIAKEKAKGGIIGINIMTATKKYEEYVKCSVDNKIDLIISGAGLPINLPELVENSKTKIAPIVSSLKATMVLLKMWDKRYGRTADMVVIEGPKAGGHLGFKADDLEKYEKGFSFDDEIQKIISLVKNYEEKFKKHIPVIFGGGVFDKQDVEHYLDMGCQGVQMATRFVPTEECDAHQNFKQAYINAKKEDIGIVKSPVGMPGRAIVNPFIRRTENEKAEIKKCYSCITHCDPKTIPYCITNALIQSIKGDTDNGLVFCGETAYRIKKMSTVKEIFQELTS